MRSSLRVLLILCATAACSDEKRNVQAEARILSINFPSVPNPPTKNLVRGTQDFAQIDPDVSPETQLSEAFLRCGLRRLSWTSFASDGGSRLIITDDEKSRLAVKCVAKTFPLDFYVVPEGASESDLNALTQTPR